MEKDTKRKIAIYGTNFLTPSVINVLKNTISGRKPGLDTIAGAANPYGAVFFGALDILGGLSNRIKNSKFTRLPKLAGAGYYGVSAILDIFSIAGGDYKSFADLVFDTSMAYQLVKDTADNYRGKNDLLDDLTKW